MRKTGLFVVLTLLFGIAAGPAVPVRAGPLPPVTEADGRLGTCFSFYDPTWNRLAYEAGSRWDRFDFRWDVIEAQPGNFSFGPHENVVSQTGAAGLNVLGILWATPGWAAGALRTASPEAEPLPPGHPLRPQQRLSPAATAVPRNLNLPWDHPDNYWGRYVYQVVAHFKDRGVHTWEIWNEPDLTGFWAGSAADYVQLLRVGYRAAKAADPQATILFGGQAYWINPGFHVQALDLLKADPTAPAYNYYFDAMSLHLYSTAETLYDVSAQVRQTVADRVGPHPLWLTETGVPIWGEGGQGPYPWAATAEEAAAFALEGYAMARAAGIDRLIYFRMHDDAGGMGERFGLSRDDHTLRPGYTAYQLAARYLRGENQVTGPFRSTTGRVTFWGTPNGRVTLIWNRTAGPVVYTHTAVLPTVTVIDIHGQAQTHSVAQGNLPLTLAPATANNGQNGALIIGGPPLLILENDTGLPVSTLSAPGDPVVTPSVTLSWQVADALSGYWYEEVQGAPTATGPWTTVAGYPQTQGIQQITLPLNGDGPWYFRARARDKVGNWEAWPATAEAVVYPLASRMVALHGTIYGDDNLNGSPDAEEPLLTQTRINWTTGHGLHVAEARGATITLTEATATGRNWLTLEAPGYLTARIPFTVTLGSDTQEISVTVGLHPVVTRLWLPQVLRTAR